MTRKEGYRTTGGGRGETVAGLLSCLHMGKDRGKSRDEKNHTLDTDFYCGMSHGGLGHFAQFQVSLQRQLKFVAE